MGKRGPCFHCGTERTPLWRNGPPEKPVLCNACGSRYRLRGTLINYAPKHLQSAFPLKKKKKKQQESKMIMINSSRTEEKIYEVSSSSCDDAYITAASEGCESNINDGSSSSESTTISCTEAGSCFEINKQEDGSQPPGEIQQSLWDVHIPSRKRSLVVYQSLSPVERLQRDLKKILRHHQDPNSSIISESQDGVLLYNLNNQIIYPSEIGLGTILLK
ncbi:GATA transcription factor 26 [Citrus sinensis]|uniref:GATA transcription factor 26 n=1 Tax=Citrus sinensis TaxID=2711 RepID=A0ACB8KBV7_CITSI|nr:GATA transcription factor 26 [Citrus sinensis]